MSVTIKISVICNLFLCILVSSQTLKKIKIEDAESGKPLSNVRILLPKEVLYSNEDGLVMVPDNAQHLEFSQFGYETVKQKVLSSIIKLKPVYNEIDEVKIVNIDIRKIFKEVDKNYDEVYYINNSLYDITYKTKSITNNKIRSLAIADAKLWTRDNKYNAKSGYRKEYDLFFQLQLNDIKYFKIMKLDGLFTDKKKDVSHDNIGSFFFNYELFQILQSINSKNSKYSGRLLAEDGDEQTISYKIKLDNGIIISGKFNYNKEDKGISYFESNYNQANYKILKKETTDGKKYDYKVGDIKTVFEFYKKDGKYIISQSNYEGDNFVITYEDEKYTNKFMRQITYNTFNQSDNKGIMPRIDYNKSIWENIPTKDQKEDKTVLSMEEQEFIKVNSDEK